MEWLNLSQFGLKKAKCKNISQNVFLKDFLCSDDHTYLKQQPGSILPHITPMDVYHP